VVKTVNQMHERNDAFEGVNAHRALSSQLGASFLPSFGIHYTVMYTGAPLWSTGAVQKEPKGATGGLVIFELQGKEKWIL